MNSHRLPDGLVAEPAGWRDDQGLTPVDALDRYLADRFEVERWAWDQSQKMSTHNKGGQMTDADEEILRGIRERLRDLGDRHLTPAARARSRPSYQDPSEHEPARNRILSIAPPRRGKVALTVEWRLPKGFLRPASNPVVYRYDFVKVGGSWRLDNRLAPQPGARPIGGLL
jgi:hypothetical protein